MHDFHEIVPAPKSKRDRIEKKKTKINETKEGKENDLSPQNGRKWSDEYRRHTFHASSFNIPSA